MSDEVVDHAARKDVAVLETSMKGHIDVCVERNAKADSFEKDMRLAVLGLGDKINHSGNRIHERIDRMLWAIVIQGGTGLLALIIGMAIYIWNNRNSMGVP